MLRILLGIAGMLSFMALGLFSAMLGICVADSGLAFWDNIFSILIAGLFFSLASGIFNLGAMDVFKLTGLTAVLISTGFWIARRLPFKK